MARPASPPPQSYAPQQQVMIANVHMGDRARLLQSQEEAQAVRVNVLNRSVLEAREVGSTRLMVIALAIVNIPQVAAAAVVMSMYWNAGSVRRCNRVNYWTLFQTIHMFLTVFVEWGVYYTQRPNLRVRWATPAVKSALQSMKYCMELIGLFWFLVGNMWVISDQEKCSLHGGGHMYNMALSMIIIGYIKIFLPCLILAALLPIVCFCLPCLIRFLNRMQDPMRGKGASKEVHTFSSKQSIPTTTITCDVYLCYAPPCISTSTRSAECGIRINIEL
jgi:hypothetical protein